MSWIKRIFNGIFPEDTEVGCGYGPFKLPANHPFTRGCNIHDFEFGEAHANELVVLQVGGVIRQRIYHKAML